MQDSAISSVSEITPRPSLHLSTQGKTEHFSQKYVYPLLIKEICDKADELESLGKQHNSKLINRTPRLRSLTNTGTEEYKEIVHKKGLFLDSLSQVVEDLVDNSLEDGPKYTIHCYNQFSSLLETRCKESKQEIQQKAELLKEQKHETKCLTSQGDVFANLVEEENEHLINQEHRQASLQFEEAKADLVKVINLSFPDEKERIEFLSVMALLVEAHINNFDSLEDQYVEVPPTSFNNPGLRCLMSGFVVVEHPHDPRKLRLSVDE